jgi:hypothetical protein
MDNPLALLEMRIGLTSAARLAEELGVSQAYLSMVRHGKKPLGPKILRYLGIERQITYRQVNGQSSTKRGTRNGRG